MIEMRYRWYRGAQQLLWLFDQMVTALTKDNPTMTNDEVRIAIRLSQLAVHSVRIDLAAKTITVSLAGDDGRLPPEIEGLRVIKEQHP